MHEIAIGFERGREAEALPRCRENSRCIGAAALPADEVPMSPEWQKQEIGPRTVSDFFSALQQFKHGLPAGAELFCGKIGDKARFQIGAYRGQPEVVGSQVRGLHA